MCLLAFECAAKINAQLVTMTDLAASPSIFPEWPSSKKIRHVLDLVDQVDARDANDAINGSPAGLSG